MAPLCNWKTLRLGYAIFSGTFASHPKPSPFPLQNKLISRHITSKISENKHNLTVNYLINSCGLSPEGAILASKRVELHYPKRPDSVLTLLRNHGFSQTQISKLVRSNPTLLLANPGKTILPKLEFYNSLGISKEGFTNTLASNPKLLSISLENQIVPTYNFLRSLLSEKNIVYVFRRGSWIFLQGHAKTVGPNIAFLRELGMSQSCISLFLSHFTSTLMRKPEMFCKVVDEVRQMGFNIKKSTSLWAINALGSKNRNLIWNRNCDAYKRWGWSEDDVLSAFKKFPQCMIVSEKKIMQVMDFSVNKMGWPPGMVAKYPFVVTLSLEKRIIPRCSVVKVLLSKGLMKEKLSLKSLLQPAENKFLERFVNTYIGEVSQLLSVYQGNLDIQDV